MPSTRTGSDPDEDGRAFEVGELTVGDGKQLAVAASRNPPGAMCTRDPDPLDYPQPRIYLCDLMSDAAPKVLICPQRFVVHLAFTPDGKRLATGASGGALLFDLPSCSAIADLVAGHRRGAGRSKGLLPRLLVGRESSAPVRAFDSQAANCDILASGRIGASPYRHGRLLRPPQAATHACQVAV
ncbi:MAG TPA: hypothetical protein VKD72_38010 [Gemmataceae bacterium]|nr:hypothetical protein [Gemmataceae bacterium]